MVKCQLLILDGVWVYIFFLLFCMFENLCNVKKEKKLNHKDHL